jgi:hypothetical protein
MGTTKGKRSHRNNRRRLTARGRAVGWLQGEGLAHKSSISLTRAFEAHARQTLARHKAKVMRAGTVVMMPGAHRYLPTQAKRKAARK